MAPAAVLSQDAVWAPERALTFLENRKVLCLQEIAVEIHKVKFA